MQHTVDTNDNAFTGSSKGMPCVRAPRFIFSTELEGASLQRLLLHNNVLEELGTHGYGVALAMSDLSHEQADVVRRLNASGIYTVAWLLLSPDEGYWFNLQNYPQAVERYRTFQSWALQHHLHFDAIGLDIEPPISEMLHIQQRGLRDIVRRYWLAHENVLYPAARAAYTELIADIHRDGYEVHTYQLPLIVDDRIAGTTLIQRALDIVDLPADLEVLMCYNSVPVVGLRNNVAGVLIASYGASADSIGIVVTDSTIPVYDGANIENNEVRFSGKAFEHTIVLAAHYTDTLYIFSLEWCIEHGLLPRIAAIDWSSQPQRRQKHGMTVACMRLALLVLLLIARFGRVIVAWVGWGLAIALLLRRKSPNEIKGGSISETFATKN